MIFWVGKQFVGEDERYEGEESLNDLAKLRLKPDTGKQKPLYSSGQPFKPHCSFSVVV